MQPWVDRYIPHDPFQTLALLIGLLFVGTLVKDLFLILNNVLVSRLAQLATFDLRNKFYHRTLRMDLATFGDQGTSDLMSRFTHDTYNVAPGWRPFWPAGASSRLKMVACLMGAAFICWRLLLLSLVIAPVAGVI